MTDPVIEFINRRFPKELDCHWLDGNCYYFAVILKARFSKGKLAYDVINGHFLFCLNSRYYDFTGLVTDLKPDKIIDWESFDEYDENVKRAVIKGCIY